MSELWGIARFRFHEGQLEEFKRLSAVCLEIVRTQDPGTLQYDTFFNEDESECIVLERFRDLDALLQHGTNIGDELGLPWDRARQRRFDHATRAGAALVRRLPRPLRQFPLNLYLRDTQRRLHAGEPVI